MSRVKADWRGAFVNQRKVLEVYSKEFSTEEEALQYAASISLHADLWHGAINLAAKPVVLPAGAVKAMRRGK